MPCDRLDDYAIVGELSLEGTRGRSRCSIDGMEAAKIKNLRGLILPTASAAEAAVVEEIRDHCCIEPESSSRVFDRGPRSRSNAAAHRRVLREFSKYDLDYVDVRGQEMQNAL